jgi:hypothetical protein
MATQLKTAESHVLKVLKPFTLDGAIVNAGDLVELTDADARELLGREFVELADAADDEKAGE